MMQITDFTQWSRKAGIYGIKNLINEKWYVGRACCNGRRSIANRFREHIRNLTLGRHNNRHLQAAWNKYGKEAFGYFVLQETANEEAVLCDREQHWIVELDAIRSGYNISEDVRWPKVSWTQDRRDRLSETNRRRWADPEYKARLSAKFVEVNNTPEAKERSSLILKQQWQDPAFREAVIQRMEEREVSEETKKKISASKKGKPNLKRRGIKLTQETKDKISNATKGKPSVFKGKKHTDESRAKMSASRLGNQNCKGRVLSEETKRKIGEANRRRWVAKRLESHENHAPEAESLVSDETYEFTP